MCMEVAIKHDCDTPDLHTLAATGYHHVTHCLCPAYEAMAGEAMHTISIWV